MANEHVFQNGDEAINDNELIIKDNNITPEEQDDIDYLTAVGHAENSRINELKAFLNFISPEKQEIFLLRTVDFISNQICLPLCQFLLENDVSPTAKVGPYETTALHGICANKDDVQCLELIKQQHIKRVNDKKPVYDFNASSNTGISIIQFAAACGNTKAVEFLIDVGADVNQRDNEGNTPLLNATQENYIDIVRILLENGANPDHTDTKGKNVLHHCAESGSAEMMTLILPEVKNINRVDNAGETALHYSVASKNATTKVLLAEGANVNAANPNNGVTATYRAAAISGNEEILNILIEAGADVNLACTNNGEIPLHIAAELGHAENVKLLIEAGSDLNHSRTDNGKTASELAFDKNHIKIYEILRLRGANQANFNGKSTDIKSFIEDPIPLKTGRKNPQALRQYANLLEQQQNFSKALDNILSDYDLIIDGKGVKFCKEFTTNEDGKFFAFDGFKKCEVDLLMSSVFEEGARTQLLKLALTDSTISHGTQEIPVSKLVEVIKSGLDYYPGSQYIDTKFIPPSYLERFKLNNFISDFNKAKREHNRQLANPEYKGPKIEITHKTEELMAGLMKAYYAENSQEYIKANINFKDNQIELLKTEIKILKEKNSELENQLSSKNKPENEKNSFVAMVSDSKESKERS